jgi:hypothetical protein
MNNVVNQRANNVQTREKVLPMVAGSLKINISGTQPKHIH